MQPLQPHPFSRELGGHRLIRLTWKGVASIVRVAGSRAS
jgi:hypothetical protein